MIRAHGADISKHNTSYSHPANPPRPVDFVIQRLSYGMNRDEALSVLTPPVLAEKIKGAYYYPSSAAPWKDQCDLFLSLMNGRYNFWAYDPEKGYNGKSLVDMVVPSMEYLLKYAGKPGLLYTNPDMWGTWFLPIQKDLLVYDLWVAHYWWFPNPAWTPNYFNVRGASTMRRDWKFWQYDPNGQGGQGRAYGVGSAGCDLNVFNGTVDDLQKFANASVSPAPVPVPPSTGLYRVTAKSLKIFAGPGDVYKQATTSPLVFGQAVKVLEIIPSRNEQWAHIETPAGWVRAIWLTIA